MFTLLALRNEGSCEGSCPLFDFYRCLANAATP